MRRPFCSSPIRSTSASVAARLTILTTALRPTLRVHAAFARPGVSAIRAGLRPALTLAVPAVLTNIATPVSSAFLTREVARFGTEAVAALAVIGRLTPLAFAVVFALSGAIGPIIGQNNGAGRPDRVRGAFGAAVLFTAVYVALASAILFVLRVPIANTYVNDGLARALAGGRTMTLGLVIPTITNSIYASSTQAIQRIARHAGYSVILVVSDFDSAVEAVMIRRLVERRVDGIILTGGEHDPNVYRILESQRIPFVLTWRIASQTEIPCVSFDNYSAGRMAMKHLLDLGHRRIGLICGRSQVNDRARERRRAFEDSLIEVGAPIDPELIFERDFEFIEGHAAMFRMLQAPDPPTAVFAANDILKTSA